MLAMLSLLELLIVVGVLAIVIGFGIIIVIAIKRTGPDGPHDTRTNRND